MCGHIVFMPAQGISITPHSPLWSWWVRGAQPKNTGNDLQKAAVQWVEIISEIAFPRTLSQDHLVSFQLSGAPLYYGGHFFLLQIFQPILVILTATFCCDSARWNVSKARLKNNYIDKSYLRGQDWNLQKLWKVSEYMRFVYWSVLPC